MIVTVKIKLIAISFIEMERTGLEPASTDGNFQETRFLTTRKQIGTTPILDF